MRYVIYVLAVIGFIEVIYFVWRLVKIIRVWIAFWRLRRAAHAYLSKIKEVSEEAWQMELVRRREVEAHAGEHGIKIVQWGIDA